MVRYMLDTDICSYVMKRSNDLVLKRLQKVPVSDVCISVVTKSELLYGVEVSPRRQQDEAALNAFLGYVEVLEFPDRASSHYAEIRAHLKKLGSMIGGKDRQGSISDSFQQSINIFFGSERRIHFEVGVEIFNRAVG